MKNLRKFLLTAFAVLAAGCASDKAAVPPEQLPVTELPPSVGENMFKGNVFTGSANRYDFSGDDVLTVYTRVEYNDKDSDWVELGKDRYSFDNETGRLYTKVISVFDPDTKRVFVNASEYEDYLVELIEKKLEQLSETEDKVLAEPKYKKLLIEYTKKQCHNLALQTFNEVVENKFALYTDNRMLVLEDVAPLYTSRSYSFCTDETSSEYSVIFNSLHFEVAKIEDMESDSDSKIVYDGVPVNDNGASFTVELYKYELDKNNRCVSLEKAGTLKTKYTTSQKMVKPSSDSEEDSTLVEPVRIITKKLHFTKLPFELKNLSDVEVSCEAQKRVSVYTY
ncbi:MAG: hypothetical protein J5780_05730 [Treponema sp.]|nr:hypothetical protein [Treponema sp.]